MSADGRGRVLLVDDDPDLLDVIAETLREAGFSVDTACDGNDALACIEMREPEVVVADVDMPGMGGYELCRRMRASGREEVPFLFCSGLGAAEARVEGLLAGADDYIEKPASPQELVLKLARQVERVRKLRAAAAAASAAPSLNAAALAAIESRLVRGGAGLVRLGRFELRGILGRGSMGTVFRAWDTKLERSVALKTVRAGAGMAGIWNHDMVRRLVSEAAMVARFNHPRVVAVHDVHEADDAAYIVMEFVDGVSLEALLHAAGRLEPGRATPLLAAVASALAAAHAVGMLHRDVKPGNVLLGRDGAIKLTDFGIAHFVSTRMRGSLFGTPGFVPPEAIRGEGTDVAGDLFALGATAYRCLAGSPAFPGSSTSEILACTLNRRPPPLRESCPEASAELEALVGGLLEPDPKRRIGDAAMLAKELERMSALWGWAWTLPALDWARAGQVGADADRPHAQVLLTLDPGTLMAE